MIDPLAGLDKIDAALAAIRRAAILVGRERAGVFDLLSLLSVVDSRATACRHAFMALEDYRDWRTARAAAAEVADMLRLLGIE